MSRVYDALRKLEEQSKEQPASTPPKTVVAPAKSADQLTAVPALQARIGPESRIVVFSDCRGHCAEKFRLIRMALRNAAPGKLSKVLLVTSPFPQDGKSTVALNLATALAEEGKVKVLLMEADLHRPALLRQLGLEPAIGLTETLEDRTAPTAAIRRIEPLGFYLMPAGRLPEKPVELLQSEAFSALLQDFRACFDWVLLDCPPAFPLADVVALRPHVDGVLLVARADSTPRETVQETVQLFKPGHVVGMILNGVDDADGVYSRYYYRLPHR